jgi:hypothetical protein
MFTELKDYSIPNIHDRFNDSVFVDRVFHVLKEDGIDIVYGDYISKFYKNGMIKLLKSLNVYKTIGRADTKKTFVHPRLLMIIETSILNSEDIGRNIVRMVKGEYCMDRFQNIDLSVYNTLESSKAKKEAGNYATYIIYNPHNNLYKVGKSKNVFKRFETLKTEFSKELCFIGYCEFDFESEIHFEYKDFRIFGEWFDIQIDHVLDIFSKYKFIDLKEKNL